MEYCEGNTLKQLIDRGILQEKPNMIWMLLREILDGLRHMHSKVTQMSLLRNMFQICIYTLGNYSSRFKTW
jgi:serine/threonine protein kinase